jgi:predicted transcriptional regulator
LKLKEIVSCIGAEILYGENLLETVEIEKAYAADLMSDVLAFAWPGTLLLTGLTNVQIVRTAQMMDIPAVVFVRGKRPQEEAVALAKNVGMPLLISSMSMYETCGLLYKAGLSPCIIPSREA